MDNLIAHIAREHRLPSENLATEILAYILNSADDAEIQDLFKYYGLHQSSSSGFQFIPQRRATESRGIPDIQVKDGDENTYALIECKFEAAFTQHQPNSYLKDLGGGGLLLFIVPERRRRIAFTELVELCRSSDAGYISRVIESQGTRASVNGKALVVASWDDVLANLKQILERLPSIQKQQALCSDLDQLRRFCKVAEKETFAPLAADHICGNQVPTLIHYLTWLTQKLISKCIEENIVQEIETSNRGSKNEIRSDFDSSLCFGQNLQLSGVPIWMGFWVMAWEDRSDSPLWIELDGKYPKIKQIVAHLLEERGEGFVVKHNFDWDGWLIAIPVKPDVTQDKVVEGAFQFVSDLKKSIEKAKASL